MEGKKEKGFEVLPMEMITRMLRSFRMSPYKDNLEDMSLFIDPKCFKTSNGKEFDESFICSICTGIIAIPTVCD
jgi:hypothetical protein